MTMQGVPIESTPLVTGSGYTDEGYRLCGCGPQLRDRAQAVFLTLFLVWLLMVAKETANESLASTSEYLQVVGEQYVDALGTYGDIMYAVGKGLQIFANYFAGVRKTILFATMTAAIGLLIFAVAASDSCTKAAVRACLRATSVLSAARAAR